MNTKTSEWLPVVGYEGLYEVSDQGTVRSLDRIIWRRSRKGKTYPWTRPGGIIRQYRASSSPVSWHRNYWQVTLTDADGIIHHHMVHTLVARAHLGERPAGMQCCHGPEGNLVNCVANLRYGTPAENQGDRVRDGTANAGSQNPMAKLTEKDVSQIRQRHAAGEKQRMLADEFCVSKATISMIVNRKRWSHS